jgi:peptidoglycan/xylan/chitin deacetylase (PgdA/CDA1 family)
MNPGGRMWRVDAVAYAVATFVVALFILTMAVEHILPEVGAEARHGRGTALPDCHAGRVALTFDGGPDGDVTRQLLDLLRAKKVVTTFFVDPARAAADLPLLRAIAAGGHDVGLYVPPAEPAGGPAPSLTDTVALFRANGLPAPTLVRPEGTAVDDVLRWTAAAAGLALAIDPGALDVGDRDLVAPRTIQERMVEGVARHTVFIAHDAGVAGLNTTAALDQTIDDVHGRGYCFGHLDDVKAKHDQEGRR